MEEEKEEPSFSSWVHRVLCTRDNRSNKRRNTSTVIYPFGTQHCLVSSYLSIDPTILIINTFSDGPTVISRPRVGVVSGTLPKSDLAQEGRRTAPSSHASGLADIRS
jgi:hypothetical protein